MDHLVPEWARSQFAFETVSLRDNQIHFLVGGSGEPVVLIHGLSGSLDWWQYNAPALAEHYRVYLIDLPGFGRLGHLTVCDSMAEYVDWLKDWMSAVQLPRIHLIGHSMGGHIGLRLVVERPDSIQCLVLVAPAGVMPATELPHYFLPLLRVLRDIPVALLPLAMRNIRQANLRTVWTTSHDLLETDLVDTLGKVCAPTLIVWGDEDPILPFSFAKQFQESIPNAELLILPGAGHIAMIDNPETFNRGTIAFLSGQPINS
jgi:pimeloyl-ACP methyl ester carboxylesterase